MSAKSILPSKPLPLSDVLRDLAVLRSSGQSIPEVFKLPRLSERSTNAPDTSAVDSSVSLSYDYIREARAAIRLHDSGKVGNQGTKIEELRTKYEDLLKGLGEYRGNN